MCKIIIEGIVLFLNYKKYIIECGLNKWVEERKERKGKEREWINNSCMLINIDCGRCCLLF